MTVAGLTAEVEARENVIRGVLPFPYADGVDVELIRRPQPAPPLLVGLVDASGIRVCANVRGRIRQSGPPTVGEITPGSKPQPRTAVYWRPGHATRREAERVAQVLRASGVQRMPDRRRAPRPVLETDAPIVVVVGSEP